MNNTLPNSQRMNRQNGEHADKGIRLTIDELLALRREALALDLSSNYRVSSTLAGGYRSKFRGRGMDFDEVRLYQPGDDIRNIDWRVTARTGKPHTKLFREERERPLFLLLDQSKHLFFGSRVAFKSVIAARAASLLIWASITAGSRIGAVLFDDSGHLEHRPLHLLIRIDHIRTLALLLHVEYFLPLHSIFLPMNYWRRRFRISSANTNIKSPLLQNQILMLITSQ